MTVTSGQSGHISDTPKLSCNPASAYQTDENVNVKCEVISKPEAVSLLWVIDNNGTILTEGQVINDHWTIIMVSLY